MCVHTVSEGACMFGFQLILCIYVQVNHVEPVLSGVFVSVPKGGAGAVKANLSCHQLLNEFELGNGLKVNK